MVFNIRLPYYVSAPGGTIDITNRLSGEDSKKINGSLNLLYVTEFEGTVPTVLMSFLFPDWDLEARKEVELDGENRDDVYNRNRLMLDNSVMLLTSMRARMLSLLILRMWLLQIRGIMG